MVAPALDTMGSQFNVTNATKQYLMMSIFLLAYSVGPFVIAPLSEMFGRVVVLQSANSVFLIFNVVCGFAQSSGQMFAFRFLNGLGASAPQSVWFSSRHRTSSRVDIWIDWRRCIERLLEQGGKRRSYSFVQSDAIPRSSHRSYSWRIPHAIHVVAVDFLDCQYR